jgi:PAS domain S-box-containing protein
MSDLPNETPPDAINEALIRLKDRALSASAEGITIADARLPDRPLIYVNAGFERLTGYSRDEVLGRNCRFLQGAGTEADTVTDIRNAIQQGSACTVEILNYRKDGTPFWNRLAITPVEDESGELTHFIGIQSDVTARRNAEDELRKAKLELEGALKELQQDLDLAARVQRSLLPKTSPPLPGLEVAWEFIPSAHLAGDFLNIFALDERHAGMYILDVSGHGASAALLSVTLSRWLSAIRDESRLYQPDDDDDTGFRITRPAQVAAYLNDRFRASPGIAQYFTMVYGVLNVDTRRFTYTAAGHPGPIQIPRRGEPVVHESTGVPIGMLADVEYGERTLELDPGDRLCLYTDGFTEALDSDGEEFGRERLVETLGAGRELAPKEVLRELVSRVRKWQGSELGMDDLSILVTAIA